jgi:hypothetical protein
LPPGRDAGPLILKAGYKLALFPIAPRASAPHILKNNAGPPFWAQPEWKIMTDENSLE